MIKYILSIACLLVGPMAFAQLDWATVLEKNEVVLLGEQAHGVESFYAKKREIIAAIDKASERELLLLVESPLVLSVVHYLQGETSNYHYPHTNTESNMQSFMLYQNVGFDLQEDCRYTAFSKLLVDRGWVLKMDADLLTMDSLLSLCILGANYQKDVLNPSESERLKTSVLRLKAKVLAGVEDEFTAFLLELCFQNRVHLADYLRLPTAKGYQQRIQFRDRVMAENVWKWIARYPAHQPVVWAANLHIGKTGVMGKKWTKAGVKGMAEYLEEEFALFRVAIVEKRSRGDAFFDEVLETHARELIDDHYFDLDCN